MAAEAFSVGAATPEAIGAAAASVTAADGVQSNLHMTLAVEEIARVAPAAGAAVGSVAAAALVLREAGQEPNGLAVCVGGGSVSADESGVAGTSEPVPAAQYADRFIVIGDDAVWMAAGAATSADLDGLAGSGLARVEVSSGEQIGGADLAQLGRAVLRLQQSAVAVGISAAAQDAALTAIADAKESGGAPDRSQAVQWALADIATEAEAARVATWHSACADTTDQGSAMALVLATDAAAKAVRLAAKIGGVESAAAGGRMAELQRDAKLVELLGGGAAAQLGTIADALLPDVPRA